MPITYKDLLEKAKSRQMPSSSITPEKFGLSKADLSLLIKMDPESFISEFTKHLEKFYQKDKDFKAMLDSDKEKGTDITDRKMKSFLESISKDIYNEKTRELLSTHPADVVERIMKGFEKSLEKAAPVTGPVKSTGPLSLEELKLFGFEEGVIDPKTPRDKYYEAIKDFLVTSTAKKMPESERANYLDRFKKTFNTAVGFKGEVELLDPTEIEYFKLGEKKLKNLKEISPEISQDTAFAIVQSLHKKRLDPEVKKDLIIKFFNTIRDKKIKAHKVLTEPEKRWLDGKKIEIMAEAVTHPKTRIEYFKGEPKMTPEERKKFRREDVLKQRTKIEDPGRVFEITRGGLSIISRLIDNLHEVNWKEELDKLAKSMKEVVPPVGEMQGYIEDIENVLTDLNVNPKDLPYLLHVEDDNYKPRLDNVALKGILERMKSTIGSLEVAKKNKDNSKIKELTKSLREAESDKNRIVKLRNMNLKGLKSSVENYLSYLKSKKDELTSFEKGTSGIRKDINRIEDGINEIRNYFHDLMRLEEFNTRWNRPSSVTEEEIKKTTELGKDFPEEEKKIPKLPAEKMAMDTDKYQKLYSKFMEGADLVDSIKDNLSNIIKVLALKMLSIIEMRPFSVEESKKLQERYEGAEGEQKKKLLSDIEKIKLLPEKLGIKKDFFNNPYGGKGPSLEKMEDILNDLVKDLDKIDFDKQIEKINELFKNLENISHWVKLSKPEDDTVLMRMASDLRTLAGVMIKKAAERAVAPSNLGAVYDISFGRKRPTSTGVTRRLPNFFVQDTAGLAKKFVEYLEKEGIPDMIKNPTADISAQIDAAVKKSLKMPGKIGDFLANKSRREFETRLDLKDAREDLKKINTMLEGKRDEKGNIIEEGVGEQLEKFRTKNIGQVEEGLKFVLDPLEKLWESVTSEEKEVPKAEKGETTKTDALNNLLGKVEKQTKTKDAPVIQKDLKDFIDSNIDMVVASKENKNPKEIFLKAYNNTFKRDAGDKRIPADADMDKDIESLMEEHKKSISEILSDIKNYDGIVKKLSDEFEKKYNVDIDTLDPHSSKANRYIVEEYHAAFDALGGTRREDILSEYKQVLGKKYDIFPSRANIDEDIKKSTESKKAKLEGLKNTFIKRRDRLSDPAYEKSFLDTYNNKFGTKHEKMPTSEDLKKDFKDYFLREQGDVKSEKELVNEFNKITGLKLKKLPSKEDIENSVKRITGKSLNFADIIKSKELALKALEMMPEEIEKRVQRMPTDVTDKRWYKDILKDKSHNKTRWIERLLKNVEEPVENIDQYGRAVKRLRGEIATLLKDKNQLVGKATKIPVDRIKDQMKQQMAQITNLIENKNSQAEVLPLASFRVTVINPLNAMLEAKDNINTMLTARGAHIHEYFKLKDFYDKEVSSRTKSTKGVTDINEKKGLEKELAKFKEEQERVLNGIKANISFYDQDIKKSKDLVDKVTADIYPYAESFIKSVSDMMNKGIKNLNKEYRDIISDKLSDLKQLVTEVQDLENNYKEALRIEKETMADIHEGFKKEAADDPYGEQLSPYEVALEKAPSKQEFIIKDKPEFYKKIQKTINYFQKITKELEKYQHLKKEDKLPEKKKYFEDYMNYFENLSTDIPNYVTAIKAEIIPGLKGLLKQKVRIPGLVNITTSLEDAVQTLDDLMTNYSSARVKLKNRIDAELKRHNISLSKIKELSEFIDPKTGKFIDFTDKEKEILKRVFLRQVYKYLDELWSQSQARMHPTMGERSPDFYNNVWQSFKNYSGVKSNRKFMSILNTYKAETKADEYDDVKRIYLKSQQLEDKKKELEKGLSDLGLDPARNNDIKELNKSIAEVRDKEKIIDRIFDEMFKGTELSYISKIRDSLREKAKVDQKDSEIEEYAPSAPVPKEKKEKDEEASELKEVAKDVERVINKIDDKLKSKEIPDISATMDKLTEKAQSSIRNIEEILQKGEWSIKSAFYKNNRLYNPNILYGSVMQSAMKNMLKWELQFN